MTETIDQARKILEARLAELDAEAKRLRQAIAQLGRDGSSGRRSSGRRSAGSRSAGARSTRSRSANGSTTSRAGRRRRRRARPGERERQLLASITQSPERRVSDHARELGVRPQQLYPVLKRLEKSKQVEKTPEGYRAK